MNFPRTRILIGVIGAGKASEEGCAEARQVGRLIAEEGAALVCGGLGGIMEAASQGAAEAGGEVIGILPGADSLQANRWVTLAIATNMGHARNIIIAHTAQALIAVEGEYGTLSEMAIGLKLGKPVITLRQRLQIPGALAASSPREAVSMVLHRLREA
jgi:uncharacterized protein (TIGR00725 family)